MTIHHLPQPPSDQELYWYFGPQRRWVLISSSLAFVLTAATMLTFALRTPALWAFLAVLALNLVALALSSVNSLRQRRLTRRSHEVLVHAWDPSELPEVDLYLPTCGEPLTVLDNAYRAVSAVDWPGALTVWVLDDAASPEVAELAASYGYRYVVRPDRGHLKKAGNLNHALTLSSARYIAVLDADFAPRPDFLRHLVPYLADPGVGIVQSPQCFDTDGTMSWIQRAAGSAQEWFFRWIQPSRDASDAAICCGSNAVYRRGAIDLAGGFARLDHSEDLFTGLALHEQGFRTLYVPVLVAKGTSPDNLASFVNQQYRWAMGNLHLLGTPVLARMRAPWRMRLCFYEGVVGYLTTAVNTFAAPLPPLVMLLRYPDDIRPWHVLPLLAPLWLWHVLLPRISRTRWRVEVIRANVLTSVAAGAAFLHTLRGRSAAWVPTGAGGTAKGGMARRVVIVSLVWLCCSTGAATAGLTLALVRNGWAPNWGLALHLLVQWQINLPLIRDLWTELRPGSTTHPPARSTRQRGHSLLPRRWPEALAATTLLVLTALLASGWVNPMLPWLS
ncbi:cellulose synthase catalytic subunit [Streptomyces sp. NBC_00257]|uniref:glycosyltransferase family 2 protein n=1 Tax=unclassified Streptomyces TaxID=2593676 RepID=UPI00225503B1|nr:MULTISPECIES: cellulose synthase catalytic subunit [unclassified Streptomyces]WTB57523.1 cellulose synthase catalytic subunit [Streptomyces sp. NBC_00826]WTH89595.1 cellulose synthase catalytic subunit [Streptomyces sp. NBC_00825]WTH98322.1 cellulose synthase catalytic subunit [Streptomyces sp. NBC_00822]MCX4863682.1 cellulose synthase catalytic subunit [Streptomyces sp. NBC_00906]MCX4894920.1 cellulose synthase catalytic subunit [Streptomyces sp. NBC_00892]